MSADVPLLTPEERLACTLDNWVLFRSGLNEPPVAFMLIEGRASALAEIERLAAECPTAQLYFAVEGFGRFSSPK